MTLHVKVVSPEKVVFEEEADSITAPTLNGEITILPNHTSLVSQLDHGELIIKSNGKEKFIAVAGGFLEVLGNTVSVLADYAVKSEHIDAIKAEEAKKRAEKLMSEKATDRSFAEAQATFRRALLELKISEKRKHHKI